MEWNVFHGQENVGRVKDADGYAEAYKKAVALAQQRKGEKFDANKVRIKEAVSGLLDSFDRSR